MTEFKHLPAYPLTSPLEGNFQGAFSFGAADGPETVDFFVTSIQIR